jgi:molecular chaperone GrpE
LQILLGNIIDIANFADNFSVNELTFMKDKTMNDKDNRNGFNEEGMNINADENQIGTSHLNEPVPEDSETEKLRGEVQELKEKYLRLVAEFDNFRKRNAKERIELIQTASKDVLSSLLEVLDDTDRAEKQIESTNDVGAIREGIRLVFGKLRNTLTSKGLKAMQVIGTEFNADQHEAITEIPAPKDELKGKILDELEKGYYLNDKIIRFPKVVVGK